MQDNSRASSKYTEGDERGYPIYGQLEEKHVHEVSNVFQFQSLSQSSYCNKYNPSYLDPGRTPNVDTRKQCEKGFPRCFLVGDVSKLASLLWSEVTFT